jgi:prepilin-type N-terminal cleavage/methylation domain-containing protein
VVPHHDRWRRNRTDLHLHLIVVSCSRGGGATPGTLSLEEQIVTSRRSEAGETLIEIIIALVIVGLVVSAYFATYSTSALASTSHRDLVTADGLLRGTAETIKGAIRRDCVTSTTYTTTLPTVPANFSPPTVTPPGQNCPAATPPQPVTITVQLPNGATKSLHIEVRSP